MSKRDQFLEKKDNYLNKNEQKKIILNSSKNDLIQKNYKKITRDEISWLTSFQLKQLSKENIKNITPHMFRFFTPDQISGINPLYTTNEQLAMLPDNNVGRTRSMQYFNNRQNIVLGEYKCNYHQNSDWLNSREHLPIVYQQEYPLPSSVIKFITSGRDTIKYFINYKLTCDPDTNGIKGMFKIIQYLVIVSAPGEYIKLGLGEKPAKMITQIDIDNSNWWFQVFIKYEKTKKTLYPGLLRYLTLSDVYYMFNEPTPPWLLPVLPNPISFWQGLEQSQIEYVRITSASELKNLLPWQLQFLSKEFLSLSDGLLPTANFLLELSPNHLSGLAREQVCWIPENVINNFSDDQLSMLIQNLEKPS